MSRPEWIRSGTGITLIGLFLCAPVLAQTPAGEPERVPVARYGEPQPTPRTWRAGTGIGFLGETPDDSAFAWNLYADRYLSENVSVGPMAQLAFTDNLAQYGFSGQAKYWIGLPDHTSRTKVFLQGGAGLVHAAFQNDDTSWLIPLGVGIHHTLDSGPAFYGTFLLNFTDLDTGRGTDADIMPGVNFGVEF